MFVQLLQSKYSGKYTIQKKIAAFKRSCDIKIVSTYNIIYEYINDQNSMFIWPTLLTCRPRYDSDLKATRQFVTVLNNTEHKKEEKTFL